MKPSRKLFWRIAIISILLTSFFALVISASAAPAAAPHMASASDPFIFATFDGDGASEQHLFIYTSTDGANWSLLADTGFSGPTGVLRDPSIIKNPADGKYYIAYTVYSYTTQSTFFNIASSSNLINWTHVTSVNAGVAGTSYTWAPEFYVEGSTIRVIASLSPSNSPWSFSSYYYTALNSTLTSWSGPTAMSGLGPNVIDTFVVKSGSTYHAFTQNGNTLYIEHATASNLNGPWTYIATGNWAGWGSGKEGQAFFQLDDGTWTMFADWYSTNGIYKATSTNLTNWSSPLTSVTSLSSKRHGTVLKQGTAPSTNTPPPPSQNPVAWYPFDGNANDSSSNGNNATVTGGTYTTGQIGQGLNLNGSSQYASLPNGIVNSMTDFSISTWVKLNGSSTWNRIFDFGSGTSVYMFLTPNSGSSNLRFAISVNSYGAEEQINAPSAMSTGIWHHVAVTKSGSVGTLYLDGVQVGQNTNMSLSPASLGNTTQNYIGRSQFPDPYMNGIVDDFRIYNRALSASEVQSLASGSSSPTNTPTRTNTPVGPTSTSTRTSTPSGSTSTPTRTSTPVGPTNTPTSTATAASGGGPVPGVYYTLKAVHSGKCMDVQAPNTSAGSKIGQWTCNGNPWQTWYLVDKGGGYYNIVSQNSGMCLDVTGASTANNAQVIQWDCGTGTNQQWQLVASGSDYQLKARHSGKCADVTSASTADGALVIQYTCGSGNNQKWTFTQVGTISPTPTAPAGGYQNPALPGYNADPTGIIFGNTFYIYPTTDGIASWGATSFRAWSSPNLVDWTDRGVILDLANVSWCHQNAWAPSIIQRNGTYYFYFSACGQTGVASSTSPTGPFTDILGGPLTTQIDPMVFADTDGSYYLYWGQGTMKWGKLNADMKSFSSTGTIAPSGFNEGSFVFKRNGIYYFMWSENDTRDENYRVAYATATSATGANFTQRGVILSKDLSLGILGTGHHSVIATSSGQHYIIYHRFGIPGGDGTHREVCIDLLNFNADGTIQPVDVTLAGIYNPVTP